MTDTKLDDGAEVMAQAAADYGPKRPEFGEHKVGQHLWVDRRDIIGYDWDWEHGHNEQWTTGSIQRGDIVEVFGFEDDRAVVKLYRDHVPYGAPLANGTIFLIDIEEINGWGDILAEEREIDKRREVLAEKYLKPRLCPRCGSGPQRRNETK